MDKIIFVCFVLDSPKLQGGGDATIFFSSLNQNITLSVIVSAVPNISGQFIWSSPDSIDYGIQPTMLNAKNKLFHSKLFIESVQETDYGVYTVSVGNGIGNRSMFTLTLNPSGK